MIDHADFELSQGKFTNPNDEAEYQLWLDSLADEEEIDRGEYARRADRA